MSVELLITTYSYTISNIQIYLKLDQQLNKFIYLKTKSTKSL